MEKRKELNNEVKRLIEECSDEKLVHLIYTLLLKSR